MSVRQLAGPHKLPRLLSVLPKSGHLAVVHSVDKPQNLYLVTRSKLKFSAVKPAEKQQEVVQKVSGAKVGDLQKNERSWVSTNPVDGQAKLKPYGKAWGMLFRHGKYTPPSPRTKLPDPEIRNARNTAWVAVDPASLPSETQTAIKNWQDEHRKHLATREAIFSQRAQESAERAEKWAVEMKERAERRREYTEKIQQVEIIY